MSLNFDQFVGSFSQTKYESHIYNESLDDILNYTLERIGFVHLLNDLNRLKNLVQKEVIRVTNVDKSFILFKVLLEYNIKTFLVPSWKMSFHRC